MSETPLDLAAVRRCYVTDMLEARSREENQCDCNWPDSVSIDGDWLHVAGEHFADALAEVERLRTHVAWLQRFATRVAILDQMTADAQDLGLYDEPANATDEAGERLPSQDDTTPTQVHTPASAEVPDSAFRMAGYEVVIDPNAGDMPTFGDFGAKS